MILNTQEILNLPVETKSGASLGRVGDFEFDGDTGIILRFIVKQGNLIAGLIKKSELIITREQVISIDKNKMIVQDGLVKELEQVKRARRAKPLEEGEMVITSMKE